MTRFEKFKDAMNFNSELETAKLYDLQNKLEVQQAMATQAKQVKVKNREIDILNSQLKALESGSVRAEIRDRVDNNYSSYLEESFKFSKELFGMMHENPVTMEECFRNEVILLCAAFAGDAGYMRDQFEYHSDSVFNILVKLEEENTTDG
tara:strand:- start:7643 stop:8092 length:450 start_codon:yes stop_codon:yes gene_type:complete